MRPTIRDVADRAGVSIATVSRVMRSPHSVSPATRERVNAAIGELQYTPSALGRQLAERRHAANGIVFPGLSGPYYAEVVLGYESVAAELGRSVLILSTHGRDAAPSMVESIADRCDGLVVLGRTVPDDILERLCRRRTPLVLVARAAVDGADSVTAENVHSAGRLAEHVLAQGARRLAFVGDPDRSPDMAERWDGLARAVESAGAGAEAVIAPVDDFDEAAGARVADAALGSGDLPDAFVCANDELALGLLARLAEAGVDVPGRVLVSGWDDVMAARYAGLTTVRQPMRELGATAARLLDELISGSRTEPRHEVLTTRLVVRASTVRKREEGE